MDKGGAVFIVRALQESLGLFKQEIMKHYNLVNQMVFKVGVTEQKVSVFEDKIIIVAKHKRIPVLEILDEADKNLSGTVDRLLIERSKQLLAERIEQSFGIGVKLILKDYDPLKEVSGTLIFLDRELN